MSHAEMNEIVERLHALLQSHPEAKVTMFHEPTCEGVYQRDNKAGFELEQAMVDLIRTNLDTAKTYFAPIHQVVRLSSLAQDVAEA